ncbi:MAG: TonB family protein [Bacteroidales bacterium]
MTAVFPLLIKINLAMAILYLAYRLFFERDKNFTVRRIFLLGTALLPLLLPAVPDSVQTPLSRMAPLSLSLEELTVRYGHPAGASSATTGVSGAILWLYLTIAGLGLLLLLAQLAHIGWISLRSARFTWAGSRIIASKSLHASSFFGLIFLDPDTLDRSDTPHILAHEAVHAAQVHSLDRLLVELFVILNWFNPLVWLYRKSVIANLEFLADSAVLDRGTDPVSYQLSILNQFLGSASLIHNSFSHHIKNRIAMLNKNVRSGSNWKLLLSIPALALAFLAVSCTEKEAETEISGIVPEPEKTIATAPAAEPIDPSGPALNEEGEPVYFMVDEMPAFNGGDPAVEFRKFIAQNLQYPTSASDQKISGRVIVQFTVGEKGEVENVVIVRGVHPDLDQEATRVMYSSPRWTPGKQDGNPVNVMFTFPINFVLE